MTDPMRGHQQFFAEMKRRHVFKVSAVYGAIAFGILQVADPLATALSLPDSFLSLVVGLLLLGFPVALVLAWAFEVTPEGLQKAEPAAPGEIEAIVAQPAAKRWTSGLLALAGIVALVLGSVWVGRQTVSGPDLNLGVPAAQAADLVKVAILPFDNVGADERNDVLAEGLHMDLQQQLGQLGQLRVTWPMSVREYRASDKGDREIARELGVDYLLRGSVRRSGDLARVDVVLVDAGSAENLWGEQYDRQVTPENLWEIQSGIALEVARRLASELSPADLASLDQRPPTEDLAALAAYNRSREIFHSLRSGAEWAEAAAQAERAVALDPEFVEAWALLTRIRASQAKAGDEDPELATIALRRTEALAPGSAEAITASAFHTALVEQDFEGALAELEAAQTIAPSDADVVAGIAAMQQRLGRWNEAVGTYKLAIAMNPRSTALLEGYARTLGDMGRLAAADAVRERALQVAPSLPGVRSAKVMSTFDRYRDTDRARSLATELGFDTSEFAEGLSLLELALYDGDFDEAVRIGAELPRQENNLGEAHRLWRRIWAGWARGDDVSVFADSMAAIGWDSTQDSWDEMLRFNVYAFGGDLDRAWPVLEESVEVARGLSDRSATAWQLGNAAISYAMFGQADRAFELLEETVDEPGGFNTLAYLQHSPDYRSLRGNARFDAIIERRRAFEEQAAREAEADRPWLP